MNVHQVILKCAMTFSFVGVLTSQIVFAGGGIETSTAYGLRRAPACEDAISNAKVLAQAKIFLGGEITKVECKCTEDTHDKDRP